MRFLLALNSLGIGGTESYVFTVAEHLDCLAHGAVIYTPEPGRGVEVARERGIEVIGEDGLGAGFDVALVQDAAASLEVAELCPATPQVFVGHSENFNPQTPPQLPGVVALGVALNERVEQRLRGFPLELTVKRLRQPIDTERFLSGGPLPEVPRRVLLLSNNHYSDRQAMLESACEQAGLELTRLGGSAGQSTDPRAEMAAADIVIGYGRSILEAMACGRAAYLYDWAGGNGWMTAESYPAIEANGFGGRSEPIIDADRLGEDLRRYDPSMGPVNRDLVMANHRANVHVQELVELATGLVSAPPSPGTPLLEMSRLVRLEWRARSEIHRLTGVVASLQARLSDLERQRVREREEDERGRAQQARELARVVAAYESTLSWRLTRPLRTLGRLRQRR